MAAEDALDRRFPRPARVELTSGRGFADGLHRFGRGRDLLQSGALGRRNRLAELLARLAKASARRSRLSVPDPDEGSPPVPAVAATCRCMVASSPAMKLR